MADRTVLWTERAVGDLQGRLTGLAGGNRRQQRTIHRNTGVALPARLAGPSLLVFGKLSAPLASGAQGTFTRHDMATDTPQADTVEAWNRTGQEFQPDILHVIWQDLDLNNVAFPYELASCSQFNPTTT